jgi:hypothetical protein
MLNVLQARPQRHHKPVMFCPTSCRKEPGTACAFTKQVSILLCLASSHHLDISWLHVPLPCPIDENRLRGAQAGCPAIYYAPPALPSSFMHSGSSSRVRVDTSWTTEQSAWTHCNQRQPDCCLALCSSRQGCCCNLWMREPRI